MDLKDKLDMLGEKIEDLKNINIYRGITTGYNPAFILSPDTKNQLIKKNPRNKEIIKSLLQGRNIKKWAYKESKEFLLFIPWHFPLHENNIRGSSIRAEKEFEKSYPDVYEHMLQCKENLESRNKEETGRRYEWYALQRCAASYFPEFEKPKIIWGLTADKWAFAYDDKKHYLPSNGYILTANGSPIELILAQLNSKLLRFYFSIIGIMTAGGAYTLKHETIGELPIKIDSLYGGKIIYLVNQILSITKDNDYLDNPDKQAKVKRLEKEIDQFVYKLYDLTPEEIEIVEGFNEGK